MQVVVAPEVVKSKLSIPSPVSIPVDGGGGGEVTQFPPEQNKPAQQPVPQGLPAELHGDGGGGGVGGVVVQLAPVNVQSSASLANSEILYLPLATDISPSPL